MGQTSKIQWTDATWNIAVGCTKVDEDCKFCYMYRESLKEKRYNPKVVRKTTSVFKMPLRLKQPSKIFTSSLTDVFHESIDEFRDEMWDIIRQCPQHTFQILTKRPERIADHLPKDWGENGWKNVWFGTSIGGNQGMERLFHLLTVRNKVHILFLSLEPLHEQLLIGSARFKIIDHEQKFNALNFIDWVIVGGESGNENGMYRYRPCDIKWIESVVEDCKKFKIPVFVKQLGTHLAKELKLSDRHGGDISEWPQHLQIRQFPSSLPVPVTPLVPD